MERVAFLIEQTDERIRCLLNPENVLLQRTSGIQSRKIIGRTVSGNGLNDDQLVYTGGGCTELTLNLLFDVALAQGSSIVTEDVRELTAPFWRLSESHSGESHAAQLPVCWFFWGKQDWNFRAVVAALAENLDSFTDAGVPRRSWMRMRLRRIAEETVSAVSPSAGGPALGAPGAPPSSYLRETVGVEVSGERLDQTSFRNYGDSCYTHEIGAYNHLDDLLHIGEGNVIDLPPLPVLLGQSTS